MKLLPAVLFVAVCLTGCRQVIRPQVEELTGSNSFEEGCYTLEICLDLVDDDLVMYYETSVVSDGNRAEWNGKATVFWANTYFEQNCHTLYHNDSSFKQWRDAWTQTDVKSPTGQILVWQEHAAAGEGKCTRNAVAASEYGAMLDPIQEKVYVVTLKEERFDWRSLCDVDLDTIFGGNERLGTFASADVYLFYSAADWSLCAVQLEHINETDYLAVTILVDGSQDSLNFSLDDLAVMDGYLSEEWSMPGVSD